MMYWGPLHRGLEGRAGGDPAETACDIFRFGQAEGDKRFEVRFDLSLRSLESGLVRVIEVHIVARRGEDLCDAVPHEAGPDHADATDVLELHAYAFLSLPLVGL